MDTGWKSPQKRRAAEGPPADAQAAQHLRLVADADLAQLDAGVEHGSQALDQAAEVHPAVGREEEDDAGALEVALHVDQLHLQLVVQNFFLADLERILLFFPVSLHHGPVLWGGQAEQGAQGGGQLLLRQGEVAPDAHGVLFPGGGLHDDPVAHPAGLALGVEIILFAFAAEANADDVWHRLSPYRALDPNLR